jgi:SPP1 gp7 family putative phage head morphogenesis protein
MAKNYRSNQRVSQVDQRLAANLHLRQVETLIDADDISTRIGGIFDKAGRKILDIATDSMGVASKIDAIGRLLMQSLADSRGKMGGEFEKLANRSYRTAADALIDSIPWPWLATLIAPDEAGAIESVLFPQPPAYLNFDAGMLTIDSVSVTEEEARPYTFSTPLDALRKARLTDKEKKDLASKLIFPPPDARMVGQVLTRGDWEGRLDSLSGQITNSRALIGELVTGYSDGEGVAALKKRIEPLVGGIKSSAQRIARTEAMRVAEAMQREAWEPLGDMMIGAQIIAVLDERTRPEHATRNGQIYYKNPAGAQRSMAELPALPDAPNCRCMASPVLSPPPDLATNKSLRDALASSEPSGLPDPATYDKWFEGADAGRRKLVVGVGRYNAMEKYLREQGLKRDLQWTDFIDSRGRLLPVGDLLAESSLDRQARKQLVGNQIRMRGKALADLSRQGFERFRRPDKIKVVNSGGLQYRKPAAGEAQGEVLVEVSAAKLNSSWQGDLGFIAADGTGAIGDRLAGAKAFISSGEPIEASQVRIRDDGAVVFVDGRHRFAAVRDAGKRTVVVSVPKDQAAAVRKQLSP